MNKVKSVAMFAAGVLVVGLVAVALIEVAFRRGLITNRPQDALANLLSPTSAAGSQQAVAS